MSVTNYFETYLKILRICLKKKLFIGLLACFYTMSDIYDGEVPTPDKGKRDFERDLARGKALRDDFLNSSHDLSGPAIDMIFQDGEPVDIPSEYLIQDQAK